MSEDSTNDTDHAVSEDEAQGSQFYVAEVVENRHGSADVGTVELVLNDAHFSIGERRTSRTYGDAEPKKWEIVAGPFDCPPLPHVLALNVWFEEEQPEEAWKAYQQAKQVGPTNTGGGCVDE